MKIFKKGELFCGPGGLAVAAKRVSFTHNGEEYRIEHTWANDIDESSCETFRNNICRDNPESVICEDVRTLDIASLDKINALTFGFPCNDFSIVGEQRGIDGNYGPLYTYGVKALKIHNPEWFLAENVGGLQSANEGETFEMILKDLVNAGTDIGNPGYEITPHLYKFEQYGVPQCRHRIIIVGIRKDLGLKFKVPAPTTPNKYKTVFEALEEDPIPHDAPNHERTNHPNTVVERLSYIPPGENAWYEGIPEHLRLKVKGARLSNIYKKLHPDKPAYTVTGSGGGGTHMYHYRDNRALTNRERARLQTFKDDHVFCGNKEQVRKQVGMAVPPDGVEHIFEAILKTFAKVDYPSIKSKWEIESG
jgi:DNA (cytosine-5)-methyltransferase 1